jgi:hypothetical protein
MRRLEHGCPAGSSECIGAARSVRVAAEQEYGPAARLAVFHLGMLYAEAGRTGEAKDALQEYLTSTEGFRDPPTEVARKMAMEQLSEPDHKWQTRGAIAPGRA